MKSTKRTSAGALKRVNAENLATLGPERLAELLVLAAAARPELKRRLRMELAAAQGPEHLAPEIEKRLRAFETSRGAISWRQRPAFLRDLEGLRTLIAGRMAQLDRAAALDQIWRFMRAFSSVSMRVRGRDEALGEVYGAAAADLGALLNAALPAVAASALADAIALDPRRWRDWLAPLLTTAPDGLAGAALRVLSERTDLDARFIPMLRQLADAADDVDAFASTYSPTASKEPTNAAAIAERLLARGRVEEAGAVLRGAKTAGPDVDFDWEGRWIDYLQASGEENEAQAARWASFERTMSVERLRDFTKRLEDFEDVEAEQRAFAHAAAHRSFRDGLRFLMSWPALSEAAQMIAAREGEIAITVEESETWAAALRRRQPKAAHTLLRRAASAAFRRRELKLADRLTQEADAINL